MTAFSRHSPLRGQFNELRLVARKDGGFGSCLLLRRFLLWLDIIVAILGMQL